MKTLLTGVTLATSLSIGVSGFATSSFAETVGCDYQESIGPNTHINSDTFSPPVTMTRPTPLSPEEYTLRETAEIQLLDTPLLLLPSLEKILGDGSSSDAGRCPQRAPRPTS